MVKIKKILKLIKYFVPPILNPGIFIKYKNKVLNRKKMKHIIEYERNFYKRHAFINRAIHKFKNCNYLEIGVDDNDVFNSIPLKMKNKFGVDPVAGGNFRMTSDEFFKKYPDLKFDIIFIDGFHEYEQCQRDCINSMRQLNENGIILFHDLLPRSHFEENVPRKQESWTGNVWKVAVELQNSKNVDFKICNIDYGIGILKLKNNFEYLKMPELKEMNFEDYLKFYKNLPLIQSEEALDFINKD